MLEFKDAAFLEPNSNVLQDLLLMLSATASKAQSPEAEFSAPRWSWIPWKRALAMAISTITGGDFERLCFTALAKFILV